MSDAAGAATIRDMVVLGAAAVRSPERRRGFSLIEVMIALVVLALIALVALPSFADAVRRSRRSDGTAALMRLQQAQERWRANQPRYADNLSDLQLSSSSASGHYVIAVASAEAHRFVATATAAGDQTKDTRCKVLRVVGGRAQPQYSALDDDGVESPNDVNRCWNR